jgi:hypothetical protein
MLDYGGKVTTQIELFDLGWIKEESSRRKEHKRDVEYWKKSLRKWPGDVWLYRHCIITTGWSMARQSWIFARFLFRYGEINKNEYRRWFRFRLHVERYHRFKQSNARGEN